MVLEENVRVSGVSPPAQRGGKGAQRGVSVLGSCLNGTALLRIAGEATKCRYPVKSGRKAGAPLPACGVHPGGIPPRSLPPVLRRREERERRGEGEPDGRARSEAKVVVACCVAHGEGGRRSGPAGELGGGGCGAEAVLWRSGRPAEDAAQTKVGSGHGSAHREAGPRAAGTKHCEFRRPASLVAAEQAVSKKIPIIVTGGITDTGILTDYIIVTGILADYIIVTGIIIDLTTGVIIAVRRSRRQPPLGWRVAKAGNLQDPAGGTCTRTSRHGPG